MPFTVIPRSFSIFPTSSLDRSLAMSITLGPSSFHPVLSVSLPENFLYSLPRSCQAYALLSLPPALFLDPWQAPIAGTASSSNGNHDDVNKAPFRSTSNQAGQTDVIQTHYLAAGRPAKVEIEKAVGWSKTSGGGGGEGQRRSDPEVESVLLRLQPSTFSGSKKDTATSKELRLPLHARYLPPISSSSSSSIFSHFSPSFQGNYQDISIDGFQLFWSCSRPTSATKGMQTVVRPSTLLPASHSHLLSPLLSALSYSSASTSKSTIYRVDLEYAVEEATIQLPRGDAALGEVTMLITQAVVWIWAVWLVGKVWKVTR